MNSRKNRNSSKIKSRNSADKITTAKKQYGCPSGPGSILAIVILCLLGLFFGTVGYLSIKYISLNEYGKLHVKTVIENGSRNIKFETVNIPLEIAWTTYKNDYYGFVFQYPKNWKITKDLFSEDFVLATTNRTGSSEVSGEIRIEASDKNEFENENDPDDGSAETEIVYGYETTFSHSTDLAGEEEKKFVRFGYFELDSEGNKIPKNNWKYFDIYEKMIESFSFINNE